MNDDEKQHVSAKLRVRSGIDGNVKSVTVVHVVNGMTRTDEIRGDIRSVQLAGVTSPHATVVTLNDGTRMLPDGTEVPVRWALYRNAEVIYGA